MICLHILNDYSKLSFISLVIHEGTCFHPVLSMKLLTSRWGFYNHALRQVANLFNEVILCVQRHATIFYLVRQ